MSAKFYVYEHWRPDIGACFYVGKGTGHRANVLNSGRNLHHIAIQKKLSRLGLAVEVKIVANGMTAEEAYQFERERIAFWRNDGADLVNRTDGGEGLLNPSAITRELIRKARLGTTATDETRAKMRASQAKRPAQTPEQIATAARNRSAAGYNWTPERRAVQRAAQKAHWARLLSDPERVAALRSQRSETSRMVWGKTPRRRKQNADVAKRGRFVGPPRPRYIRKPKDSPHGNKGKKMPPHVRAAILAATTGRKDTPEMIQKKRKSWTPERRAKQAKIALRVCAKRYALIGSVEE